jgi:hypothetical protein
MNQLSLRNDWLKFNTSEKSPTGLDMSIYRTCSNLIEKNGEMSTYDWLDLETLGY